MASTASPRLPECPLFRRRSSKGLPPLFHRKRCEPNRGKWLQSLPNTRNGDALTVQSNPMSSVPLQQHYAHRCRASLPRLALGLTRSYHSASLPVRSLPLWSLGKRRSLQDATRTQPDTTDRRRLASGGLPYERFPSARSEQHASRTVVRPQNRQNGSA